MGRCEESNHIDYLTVSIIEIDSKFCVIDIDWYRIVARGK
jgi:hypothetical protein